MTSVVEVIKSEHRAVEALFEQFEQTGEFQIAMKICQELTVHAELEEQLVYPEVGAEISEEMEHHAEEEHDEAKDLISKIQNCDPQSAKLQDLMRQLKEGISHHVEEEESEILPAMEKTLGAVEIDRLGDEFMNGRAEIMASGGILDVEEAEDFLDSVK